jgi:hypothetical protein
VFGGEVGIGPVGVEIMQIPTTTTFGITNTGFKILTIQNSLLFYYYSELPNPLYSTM